MKKVNRKVGKVVLALSIAALVLWSVLGTGTSLAWFADESEEVNNIFNVAEFELTVTKKVGSSYVAIDGTSDLFDTSAIYEPGYVEVICLKAKNDGTVPFNLKTAVAVKDYNTAVNVFGQTFNLQDYLKFGIVIADSEQELAEKLSSREKAVEVADMPLDDYETDYAYIEASGEKYIGLVVTLPQNVGNIANYRGDHPTVDLMLVMTADQIR